MRGCEEELCPNWSGDGNVCPCAIFDLDRSDEEPDLIDAGVPGGPQEESRDA